jgi:dTDP-glucose 4,6-dehydratase
MRILVTGGCGFIGSNFIHHLIKSTDDDVLNIDKLTYAGNLENHSLIEQNKKYTFKQVDICDYLLLSNIIYDFKPDTIVHFAAESHVDRSINSPMSFVNTNLVGTATILRACLDYWTKQKRILNNNLNFKFLHISTDEVFGSLEGNGLFNEESSYNPSSPYSASKAGADHLVRAWNRTYAFPSLITNCSNNYGPYQFPEKLIPLMIAKCIDQEPLPVYGDGLNIRDWLFVQDHCEAIYEVLLKGEIGETYNIGGNNEVKNIDIVNTICSLLDKIKPRNNGEAYSKLISFVKDRPGHDFRYAIDCSKIKNKLTWMPKENFNSGILKTIEWYLANEEWWRNIQSNNYNQERLGTDIK